MPFQQPLPPKGDAKANRTSPRPLPTQPGARCGDGLDRGLGLRDIAGEGVSLQTGAEPCIYKPWSSGPGGLLSTPTPRLTWQSGEVLPAVPAAEPRHTGVREPSAHGLPPAAVADAASGR